MNSEEQIKQIDLCRVKYKQIQKELISHEKRISKHNDKIAELIANKTQIEERLDNLIKELGKLSRAIWGLITFMLATALTSLVSFFIWYIQTL